MGKDFNILLRWKVQEKNEKICKEVTEKRQRWPTWKDRDNMNIKKYITIKNGPNLPASRINELLQTSRQNVLSKSNLPNNVETIEDVPDQIDNFEEFRNENGDINDLEDDLFVTEEC